MLNEMSNSLWRLSTSGLAHIDMSSKSTFVQHWGQVMKKDFEDSHLQEEGEGHYPESSSV
jgi:hypothetical protein